jgi:hypothetical protein
MKSGANKPPEAAVTLVPSNDVAIELSLVISVAARRSDRSRPDVRVAPPAHHSVDQGAQ